jgi:hypothetical protein
MNACPGGCVGGVMAVENPNIARVRSRSLQRYMPVAQNHVVLTDDEPIPREFMTVEPGEYSSAEILDADRMRSFRMMSEIERIRNLLPGMDCGSCGAPTCRAHAEDVVKGESKLDDCVIRMREHLRELEHDDGK